MLLVDGDYCSKVEHECLKSWYDESNKKTVCEEFEPKSTCKGDRVLLGTLRTTRTSAKS